jgi:hypothetical protein
MLHRKCCPSPTREDHWYRTFADGFVTSMGRKLFQHALAHSDVNRVSSGDSVNPTNGAEMLRGPPIDWEKFQMRLILFASRQTQRAVWRLSILRFGRARRFKNTARIVLLGCLSFLSGVVHAEPMQFRLIVGGNPASCFGACGTAIAAEGEITDATPDDFRSFIRMNATGRRGPVVVFIDSPGGKIVAGTELGKSFRKIGATVAVARLVEGSASERTGGVCFSACVYALMGAKRRIAPRGSRIGVHRMFAYDGVSRRFDNGEMAAMLRRYAYMMGVSPELVVATEQGTPDAIRILTPAEIARWRLASPGS